MPQKHSATCLECKVTKNCHIRTPILMFYNNISLFYHIKHPPIPYNRQNAMT